MSRRQGAIVPIAPCRDLRRTGFYGGAEQRRGSCGFDELRSITAQGANGVEGELLGE